MSRTDEMESPDFDEKTSRQQTNEPRRQSSNDLYRTDALTTAMAFINSIRIHRDGDRENVFVSLSMMVGRERDPQNPDDFVPVYEFVDVLAGRTIAKSLKLLQGEYSRETGKLFGRVEIRNLRWKADVKDDKVYMNSRGILETFQMGYLD